MGPRFPRRFAAHLELINNLSLYNCCRPCTDYGGEFCVANRNGIVKGHQVMKRRNAPDGGKPRRPVKRPTKIGENFYGSSTLIYIKLLLLWGLVLLADHFLEFRFEYLWPFWLFLRSVYDSFKYQGLAFSVFFICIAITSDMICFLFIPVHWLFFAASTYVWVQYVWHTEKGFCVPTVFLWLLFVYIEASIRLKEFKAHIDLKHLPFHLDLCRPFAAHCIGYPVVTLGFGFKSYVGYRMRQRRQREVQKDNEYYYEFLREALPPGPVREEAFSFNPQPSPKPCSEDRISDAAVISPPTPSLAASVNNSSAPAPSPPISSNSGFWPSSSSGDPASNPGPLASNGKHASNQHHNGDLGSNGSLHGLAMSNGGPANNNSTELDYMERMKDDSSFNEADERKTKAAGKLSNGNASSTPRDASRKGPRSATAIATKEDQLAKMEMDLKRMKVDLQLSRNKENDLRDQIVSYMTGERTLKSEISNLQVEKSLLESRVNGLLSTRAGEKAALSSLERKLADERKQKADFQIKLETERKTKKEAATAERTAQQNQTRSEVARLEAEIKTLRVELDRARDRCEASERETYTLRAYKDSHGDPEVLAGLVNSVREKNRQLEVKLSDETKLKMDLFSALGEAKRDISVRDKAIVRKDREIADLKAKIAEVLACMPASSSAFEQHSSSNSNANNSSALGLSDLEDKLTGASSAGSGSGGFFSPALLGGSAYNPKPVNGSSGLDA